MSAAITIPGGNDKGKLPSDPSVTVRSLEYWADKANDLRVREACAAELQRRSAGGRPAQRPATQTQQRMSTRRAVPAAGAAPLAKTDTATPVQLVGGTFPNGALASKALAQAAEQYLLITPATAVGRLPEGCEIAINIVQIDPYADVYQITGDRKNPRETDTVGLDRVALAKIGAAAGVTWQSSKRTDDGSHPHYCAWQAVALYRLFDGTVCRVPGNVDIDAREDGEVMGPAAEEIRNKAAKRRRDYPNDKADGGDSQLLELRKFLTRHCESKAMNKAIGNMGVKRSYKRSELRKPFAVARLIFTGHSDDPEARREFRKIIANSFMSGTAALYGADANTEAPALTPAHHAPSAQLAPVPPPPIGASYTGNDYAIEAEAELVDDDAGGEPQDETPEHEPSGENENEAADETARGDDPNNY